MDHGVIKPRARVVLACQASPEVGLGHLSRIMGLAEALLPQMEVYIAAPRCCSPMEMKRRDIEWLDRRELLRSVHSLRPSWVIIDELTTYEPVGEIYSVSPATRVAVTEYWSQRWSLVDLAILPFDPWPQRGEIRAVEKLVGLKYLILRPDVLRYRRCVSVKEDPRRVTVCFGGSDPKSRTQQVLETVLQVIQSCEVRVALGRLLPEGKKEHLLRTYGRKHRVRLEVMPEGFMDWLSGSDIVVCAGGATLAECVFLGVPAISWPINDAEHRFASLFYEAGAALLVEDRAQLARALELLAAADLRREMSLRAMKVLDGRGAERVATVLLDLLHERRVRDETAHG